MKKIIFAIFAHPDDEAFGPSGTLLMEAQSGTELHLMSLTLGEAGVNPDNHENLADVREKEWRRGGELMGATSMNWLGLKDGCLCNTAMIKAGGKIVELVTKTLETAPPDAEIEFMTSDLNGISGHIDHIVAARAACWAFYELKKSDSRLTRIRLACLTQHQLPSDNTDWLYMEAGHSDAEIDEIVDARQYRDEIIAIMRAHRTQRDDGETHIAQRGDQLGMDYFLVKK